ncbi:hypothetical protein QUF63_06480 [Anaerolineales bacterium HSG25]|nr:hypothetical protein [Anaerolineales bacterium HSG25]
MKNLSISIKVVMLGIFAISIASLLKPVTVVEAQTGSNSKATPAPTVTATITTATSSTAVSTQPITMTMGQNIGQIEANEVLWFSFQPEGDPFMQLPMTLFIVPNETNAVQNVSLELFEPDDELDVGASSIVSRDGKPDTGELSWRGWVEGEKIYRVRLENKNSSALDYWLFTEDVIKADLEKPTTVATTSGMDIANPITLNMEKDHTKGRLQPGEERWYVFSIMPQEIDAGMYQSSNLTVFFTPNNNKYNLEMNIFDASAPVVWARGEELKSIGAGVLRIEDEDPNTGEIEWSGMLIKEMLHYIHLKNDNSVPIDYYLFPYDTVNVSIGDLEQ